MIISPFRTKLTREIQSGDKNPSRNMWNGKPYRTARQKADARLSAKLCADGAYRSNAPVSWHPLPRQSAQS